MLDFRSNSRNIHFFQHTTHKKSTKNAKTGEKKEDETNNNIDSLAPIYSILNNSADEKAADLKRRQRQFFHEYKLYW